MNDNLSDTTSETLERECGSMFRGTVRGTASVAVKRIPLTRCRTSLSYAEIAKIKQLSHTNVTQVYHVKDRAEFRYLILELCEATISNYLNGEYRGPFPDDLDALYQMSRGLRYIHSHHFVHEDIRPETVLIAKSASGTLLKLSEFGFESVNRCQHVDYRAPELYRGEATAASDVFSLGCVFMKLAIRGKCEPDERNFLEIIRRKSNFKGLVGNHFSYRLIERMLEVNPKKRPSSSDVCLYLKARRPDSPLAAGYHKQLCNGQLAYEQFGECRFHPFKAKLACALNAGRACIFSGQNSSSFSEWDKIILQGLTRSFVRCIDWKADGNKLAAGCDDGTLIVWDVDGKKSFELRRHDKEITCVRWNKYKNSTHILVTGSYDQKATVWDTASKTIRQVFQFHTKWIKEVVWISADTLATCADDKTIQICRLGRSTPVHTIVREGWIKFLKCDGETNRVLSSHSDGTIKIWTLGRSDDPVVQLKVTDGQLTCYDWFPRSTTSFRPRWWIVAGCGDGSLLIWDFELNTLPLPPKKVSGHSAWVYAAAFSPNGNVLASIDHTGNIFIWCTKNWEIFYNATIGRNDFVFDISWDLNGTRLAVGDRSDQIHVIEIE